MGIYVLPGRIEDHIFQARGWSTQAATEDGDVLSDRDQLLRAQSRTSAAKRLPPSVLALVLGVVVHRRRVGRAGEKVESDRFCVAFTEGLVRVRQPLGNYWGEIRH